MEWRPLASTKKFVDYNVGTEDEEEEPSPLQVQRQSILIKTLIGFFCWYGIGVDSSFECTHESAALLPSTCPSHLTLFLLSIFHCLSVWPGLVWARREARWRKQQLQRLFQDIEYIHIPCGARPESIWMLFMIDKMARVVLLVRGLRLCCNLLLTLSETARSHPKVVVYATKKYNGGGRAAGIQTQMQPLLNNTNDTANTNNSKTRSNILYYCANSPLLSIGFNEMLASSDDEEEEQQKKFVGEVGTAAVSAGTEDEEEEPSPLQVQRQSILIKTLIGFFCWYGIGVDSSFECTHESAALLPSTCPSHLTLFLLSIFHCLSVWPGLVWARREARWRKQQLQRLFQDIEYIHIPCGARPESIWMLFMIDKMARVVLLVRGLRLCCNLLLTLSETARSHPKVVVYATKKYNGGGRAAGIQTQMQPLLNNTNDTANTNNSKTRSNILYYCANSPLLSIGFNEMLASSDDEEEEQQKKFVGEVGTAAVSAGTHGGSISHLRRLLIECAESVSQCDWQRSNRIISVLSRQASPYGDSTDRLVCQFSRALALRISIISSRSGATPSFSQTFDPEIETSYLSLNQVTPFIRFAHLTANQAILEALEGQDRVHIVDFNIMQGVQWPPFMQALAERSGGPPSIRMTGTGFDSESLYKTGRRLERFAQSLGLSFEFYPMHIDSIDDLDLSCIPTIAGESLAINCVLQLHRLLKGGEDELKSFLGQIKSMEPKVVALAEREANHNHPVFLDRFMEAVAHYSALFDSLEATLPPKSQERLNVEQVWFGREITNIVSCEGPHRYERHQRFDRWMEVMNECGFTGLPLSEFALSQARLLLRLHYPSEGYQLQLHNNSFFLGWQHSPLFSVSSWH
eukprot:Gb_14334 [translate_table: standard]